MPTEFDQGHMHLYGSEAFHWKDGLANGYTSKNNDPPSPASIMNQ